MKKNSPTFCGCARAKGDAMMQSNKVLFEKIAPAITGVARIVRYTNSSVQTGSTINMHPTNLKIFDIEEGEFTAGLKDGYCRVLHAEDQTCESGFYKKGEPYGKFEWHQPNHEYINKPGIYNGYENCTKEMKLRSFEENVSPQGLNRKELK